MVYDMLKWNVSFLILFFVDFLLIVLVVCLGGDRPGLPRVLRYRVMTGYDSYCATFQMDELADQTS